MAFLITTDIDAQDRRITYTASFTKKIDKHGIDIYEPVEQWLHVHPLDKDGYLKYDLVLQNDINDFEVRYRIRPFKGKWRTVPNQIEVQRMVTSISSNADDSEIRFVMPDSSFFMETFNARDGYLVDFIPKESFSEKPFGNLVSIESTDNTVVDIILLHNDPQYDPMKAFRHIRFR